MSYTDPVTIKKSLYEIAVQNGFTGTEADWIGQKGSGGGTWDTLTGKPSTFPPSTNTHPNDHAAHSDDQDLSGKVDKVTSKSLVLDTEIAKIHTAGSDNQDLSGKSDVGHTHNYEPANSNIQTHVTSAHAPSNAVALATVKAYTDIASAVSLKHSNSLDHAQLHASTHVTGGNDVIANAVAAGNSGLMTGADKTKLDGLPSSNTWKTGITTRDITTASGVVNVAHGLGRIPKLVRVTALLVQTANTTECHGCYDGTNHSGLCTIQQEGTSTAVTDTIYSSTAFELGFSAATVVNPYTGANRQTCTITVDVTNIIFTWTKTGTVATAVANIMWEVN